MLDFLPFNLGFKTEKPAPAHETNPVQEVPKGVQFANHIIENGVKDADSIYNSFPEEELNQIMALTFKTLWTSEKHKKAIELLTVILWPLDVLEILALFPFIHLANPPSQRKYLHGLQQISEPSKELLSLFGQFLIFTSKGYRASTIPQLTIQLSYVDTALFQYYALNHMTREIDSFMKSQNSIDFQLVLQFFKDELKRYKLYPAYGVYHTRTNNPEAALKIWEELNSKSEIDRWALEASFTLHSISDSIKIERALSWITPRSQDAAVNSFLHPDVEPEFAFNWIKTNVPIYQIKFLDYYVSLKPREIKFVDIAISMFLDIYLLTNLSNFDSKNYTFDDQIFHLKTVSEEQIVEIKSVVETKILNIFREFHQKLKLSDYTQQIQKTSNRKFLLDFYQIGEMYKKASDLFFSGDKLDMQEVEDFCRGCSDSKKAFNEVISRFMGLDFNFINQNLDFLIRNLDWMDHITLLSWIPSETKVSDIDRLLVAIDALYIQKERINQISLSVATNVEIDTEYKLVKARKRSAEILYETTCKTCGKPVGEGWIAICPSFNQVEKPNVNPEVYHVQCKPPLRKVS